MVDPHRSGRRKEPRSSIGRKMGFGLYPFETIKPGAPVKLFGGRYVSAGIWNREYCLSPDGSRFLMLRNVPDPDEYRRIEVVLNWSSELARLIPAGR